MKQLSLFDSSDRIISPRPETLVMDRDALLKWKQRIFEYQQSVRELFISRNSDRCLTSLVRLGIHRMRLTHSR